MADFFFGAIKIKEFGRACYEEKKGSQKFKTLVKVKSWGVLGFRFDYFYCFSSSFQFFFLFLFIFHYHTICSFSGQLSASILVTVAIFLPYLVDHIQCIIFII